MPFWHAQLSNPMKVARAERSIRELCEKLCERARNVNKLIVKDRFFRRLDFR